MKKAHPNFTILIGFFLVMMGFIIPVMIIMKYLPSTFFLNFLAYACSVAGLMMGIIGAANSAILRRHKKNMEQFLLDREESRVARHE